MSDSWSLGMSSGGLWTGKTLQHPFDLVQTSWAPCGGLRGWFHSQATNVAAPIAGLIGIGYVALPPVDLPVSQMQMTRLHPDYVAKLPYLAVAMNGATHTESPLTTNPVIHLKVRKDATPPLPPNRRTKTVGVQSRLYGLQLPLSQLLIRTMEYRTKQQLVERTRPSVSALWNLYE